MTKTKLLQIDDTKLPTGWYTTTIGDISLYIQRGRTPKYAMHSDLPVINQRCVRWDGLDRSYCKFIAPDQYDKWTAERYLTDGDILLNSTGTGTIGRAALVKLSTNEKLVADSHITIIRLAKGITPKYVHYWLMSSIVQKNIELIQSGSTNQVELSRDSVEKIPIPLAPTKQQHLIVSKIEELFSHIHVGIENLNKAKRKIHNYRESLLNEATKGELTRHFRNNNTVGNISKKDFLDCISQERRMVWENQQRHIFEKNGLKPKDDKWKKKYKPVSFLNDDSICSLPELPDGWFYIKLGNIIEEPKYGTSKKCTYDSDGLGVLRIPNIVDGVINSSDMKYANFSESEIEAYSLKTGDILMIRSNGSISIVGKCAEISDKNNEYLFAGYLIRLRTLSKHVHSGYVKTILSSRLLRNQIESLAKSSSGVNNINIGEIQSLVIPICSYNEQKEIYETMEIKNQLINKQLDEYEKLTNLAAQKKSSILKKAFSGMLIKETITNEPAKDLLNKINEEKKYHIKTSNKKMVLHSPKVNKMTKKFIIDILKESNKALSVDEIFYLSGRGSDATIDSIEDFYQELKDVISNEYVSVMPIVLDGIKQEDKLKYKGTK